MTASPRLKLKNLTITHDGGALVSDLSLTLAAHRITALVEIWIRQIDDGAGDYGPIAPRMQRAGFGSAQWH